MYYVGRKIVRMIGRWANILPVLRGMMTVGRCSWYLVVSERTLFVPSKMRSLMLTRKRSVKRHRCVMCRPIESAITSSVRIAKVTVLVVMVGSDNVGLSALPTKYKRRRITVGRGVSRITVSITVTVRIWPVCAIGSRTQKSTCR